MENSKMIIVILSALCGLLACSEADLTEEGTVLPETPQMPEDMKRYTNSIGMSFVEIPAGTFDMGADDAGAYRCERPQHRVTISQPFYIGVYEVTQADWEAVMGYNPYDLDRSNPYYNLPGMADRITRPNHPATVSWEDARNFIRALNEREGHERYRLPTEAEWEYAARGGTVTVYSFGEYAGDLDRYAWHGGNFDTGGTHPVGQKMPNPWGLYDVHGNVWEWVQDWYSESYYAESPETDPQGPAEGRQRAVRGGSWHASATSWRSTYRKPYSPDYRGISIGFRLVMETE